MLSLIGFWALPRGAIAPGTNNGAESCVKNTRSDAGNVVGSVGEIMAFLLAQVESVSKDHWDPKAARKVDGALWQRASAFSTLFGTAWVRKATIGGRPVYCCGPRGDPADDDVCNRQQVSMEHAVAMIRAFNGQRNGAETSVDMLVNFAGPSGARVFGFEGERAFCSCPAFYHPRRCFHTLGLEILLGKVVVPDWLDATPVSLGARGNKPRAPGRGAVPLKADEKDLHIARLEAQVRKLTGKKIPEPKRMRVSDRHVTTPALWLPSHRLPCKTSGPRHMPAPAPPTPGTGCPAPPPPEAAEVADPPLIDAAEQRRLQNALALVANLDMLESDPSIGKDEVEFPAKQPRLEKELLVAANGRCFTLCCIAAMATEEWTKVARKPDGTPVSLEQLVAEDDKARNFLLTKVLDAGMPGDRIGELLHGEYAEAHDFPFFASAMGGSIGVTPTAGDRAVKGVRYFGNGPLRMQVQLYYLHATSSPHYKLMQSWW